VSKPVMSMVQDRPG